MIDDGHEYDVLRGFDPLLFVIAVVLALIVLGAISFACAQPAEIPDPIRTPGVVAEDGHDVDTVCGIVDGLSYSKRHRATPRGLRRMIRKRDQAIGQGEVDHRGPISLGFADVVYNLWWQPGPDSGAKWTFKDKDALEILMWHRVCLEHSYPLDQAQSVFLAPDWRAEYCKVFADDRCK